MAHLSTPIYNVERELLNTHNSIVSLNKSIKDFKANPSGNSHIFLDRLDQIKQQWDLLGLAAHLPIDTDYEAVVDSIGLTQNKVEKLLKKYPPQAILHSGQTLSPAQQIAQRARLQGYISFYDSHTDALTCCFGNFYGCRIEFGQKYYQNSEAVFQAQKFTDQSHIMSLFPNVDAADAVTIARKNSMTPNRLKEWDSQTPGVNKVDVMMNALRAKFGQNPNLKEMLMATGDAFIVERLPDATRRDKFWSDGFDGTGENMLGICLMRLRKEYGGTGVVGKATQYTGMLYQSSSAANFQAQQAAQVAQYHLQQTQPTNFQAQLALQTKCIHCKTKPKFIETSGKIHDYCGKTCAKQAGALNQ